MSGPGAVEVETKLNLAVQETDVVLAREGKSSPKVQSDEWEHHPKGIWAFLPEVSSAASGLQCTGPCLAPGELRR